MTRSLVALRMDDVGACSKTYEVYSNLHVSFRGHEVFSGNWLFLKYLSPFKAWGPYQELTEDDWQQIFWVLTENNAKLTVAVTAAWAESFDTLIPFNIKFPAQAELLRHGVESGLIEIANHGLTHCVLDKNYFKPKYFKSNRQYHREFSDLTPSNVQEEHIRRSQEILQSYFRVNVKTFVPPGNAVSDFTLELARENGLRYISCNRHVDAKGIKQLDNSKTLAFHDRDYVMGGTEMFGKMFQDHPGSDFVFLSHLGEVETTN
jgi:hypothetical protein